MALVDTTWYVNFGDGATTGYYAIAKRAQNAAVVAGQIVRQFTAPAAFSERAFICIIAGTTANVTDATWVLTRGAKTVDGTATWMECSGQAALCGDLVNTTTWAQVKAATPAVLGQIIKRSTNTSYQICTTAGAMSAAEPTMSDTAGVTTTDTTAVWTSLGPVGNFTGGQVPHARIGNCVNGGTWAVAGNTTYIHSANAETAGATIQINPLGSATTVTKIACHNGGAYPPASSNLTTGASVSATGGQNLLFFNGGGAGTFYFYGMTFINSWTNLAFAPAANSYLIAERCSFQFNLASNASLSLAGACTTVFNNVTFKFGGAGQAIYPGGNFIWQNTGPILEAGSVVPTARLMTAVSNSCTIVLEAIDLSQIPTAVLMDSTAVAGTNVLIKDCKLNAPATTPVISSVGNTQQYVRSS